MHLTNNTFTFPLQEKEWREFAYYSANVCHIFGPKDFKEMFPLYERAIQVARLQSDRHTSEWLSKNPCPMEKNRKAEFFVSFHFGKYRLVPLWLISSGRSVAVVISQEVIEKFAVFYSAWMKPDSGRPGLFLEKAENPFLGLRIRKYLEDGVDIFVYADGNSGAKGTGGPDGLKEQQLLNGCIEIRKGFMELAHLLSARVRFVLETSGGLQEEPCFQILEQFDPNSNRDRSEFVDQALRSLYARFSEFLEESPVNWECLFYLHLSRPPNSDLNGWSPEHRLMPLSFPSVLDRFSYRIHQLDGKSHSGLCKFVLD